MVSEISESESEVANLMCWEDLGSERIGLLKMGLEELVLIDSVDSNVVLKPFIFFIPDFKM